MFAKKQSPLNLFNFLTCLIDSLWKGGQKFAYHWDVRSECPAKIELLMERKIGSEVRKTQSMQ